MNTSTPNPRWGSVLTAVLTAVLAALALPAISRADYADLYRAGLRSFEVGYFREALVFFEAAAQEQPRADRSVREYGMWRTPYLPYYQQGRALYRLGRYAAALRALEESETQGAIKGRQAKKHYKSLLRLRDEIRQRIDQEVRHLYRGAAADYETVDQLRRSPALAHSKLSREVPPFDAIDASLQRTTANLKDASLFAAASELQTAISLLDQARDGIAEMAQVIQRREREMRDQQDRRDREERLRAARQDTALAEQLLASGHCSPPAIQLLERLDLTGLSQPDGAPIRDLEPELLLAQAHAQCDHFALAQHYLERASLLATEASPRRQDVTHHLEQRIALADAGGRYAAAAARVAAGDCDGETIESLEDLLRERQLSRELSRDEPPLATLLLVLAEAHWDCGEPEAATAVLRRAEQAGATAPERISNLAAALAGAREPAGRSAKREELAGLYQRAKQRIETGLCDPLGAALIHRLVRGKSLLDLGRSHQLAEAHLALARARLGCDELDKAEAALAAAEAVADLDTDFDTGLDSLRADLRAARQQLADRVRREEALSDYLLASARSEGGDCREGEVSALISKARSILESDTEAAASPLLRGSAPAIPYRPNLVLARAYSHCKDRDQVERYVQLADGLGEASSADLEELEAWLERHPKLQPYSGSYALLVGAYDYSGADGWPTLYKPGEDVREVRATLELHGFQVETLENPTSEQLEETLDGFFLRYGSDPGHRLVFYYAGHGHTEITLHGVKLGYLVPVDAGDPKQDRAILQDLFGMERFREYAIGSNANDLLFMFDSCFAGTVFKATRSCVPPACEPPDATGVALPDLISRPVRMFMTAGDEEERVPDESLFRHMVTRALNGEADANADRFILGSELGAFVQTGVASTHRAAAARFKTAALGRDLAEPKWGTLIEGNFGRGDLLFHVPGDHRRAPPSNRAESRQAHGTETEVIYWSAARNSRLALDYLRYLERYPTGRFAPLARWILQRLMPGERPAAGAHLEIQRDR